MNKRLLTLLLTVVPMLTFAQEKGIDQQIDEGFKPVSDFFSNVIFFQILGVHYFLQYILVFQTLGISGQLLM